MLLTIKDRHDLRSDLHLLVLSNKLEELASAITREEGSSTSKIEEKPKEEKPVVSAYQAPTVLQAVAEVGKNLAIAQLLTFFSVSFLASTLAYLNEGY
ncbi:hypothetical protein [Simkania sp.]|uniref:hypothetical protein n=1 Tax=Simkania sp. TaxID=34094 RepID=UPI003B52121D